MPIIARSSGSRTAASRDGASGRTLAAGLQEALLTREAQNQYTGTRCFRGAVNGVSANGQLADPGLYAELVKTHGLLRRWCATWDEDCDGGCIVRLRRVKAHSLEDRSHGWFARSIEQRQPDTGISSAIAAPSGLQQHVVYDCHVPLLLVLSR
jgi:hypothetical protein